MASFVQDLRYALRTLLKSPGFTAVTVLTLAIGIGANTALFSVIDSLLLRPLPYPDADRIVILWARQPDGGLTNVSPADFLDYREQNRVFEHIGALSQAEFNVTIAGAADRLTGFRISPGFLESLGIQPVLGRRYSPAERRQRINARVAGLLEADLSRPLRDAPIRSIDKRARVAIRWP